MTKHSTHSDDRIATDLRALDAHAPDNLFRRTVVDLDTADEAATTDSPLGPVWIAWNHRGITAVSPTFSVDTFGDFAETHRRTVFSTGGLPTELTDVVTQALDTGDATDVPIDFTGIGSFQTSVLEACAAIPVGQVRPYGWIATEIDNPGSVRAVGTALGRNPIPLLIPCHRVVRSDGAIGNYAFGPDRKRTLLVREGALLA